MYLYEHQALQTCMYILTEGKKNYSKVLLFIDKRQVSAHPKALSNLASALQANIIRSTQMGTAVIHWTVVKAVEKVQVGK